MCVCFSATQRHRANKATAETVRQLIFPRALDRVNWKSRRIKDDCLLRSFIQFQKYMKKMPWKTWHNLTLCRLIRTQTGPDAASNITFPDHQEGAGWCIAVCSKLLRVYDSLLPKQTLNASCSVTWTPAGLQTAHYWLWGGHQSSFWLPSFKFGMNGGEKKEKRTSENMQRWS